MTDVDLVRQLAYEAGYADALTLAAQRVDELDVVWQPIVRPSYEEVVAARIAAMESFDGAAWAAECIRLNTIRDAEAIRIGHLYEPDPCTRCGPVYPVICRCCGIVTYVRTNLRRAA